MPKRAGGMRPAGGTKRRRRGAGMIPAGKLKRHQAASGMLPAGKLRRKKPVKGKKAGAVKRLVSVHPRADPSRREPANGPGPGGLEFHPEAPHQVLSHRRDISTDAHCHGQEGEARPASGHARNAAPPQLLADLQRPQSRTGNQWRGANVSRLRLPGPPPRPQASPMGPCLATGAKYALGHITGHTTFLSRGL